jgi:hypothetical protein
MGNKIGCGGFGTAEQFLEDTIEVFAVTQLCAFATAVAQVAETDEVQDVLKGLTALTDFVCTGEGGLATAQAGTGGYSGGWLPSAV